MQPHGTKIKRFRMSTRYPHQRSEGTRGTRGWIDRDRRTCTNLSCDDEATATVLVGADRMPKCFTHEREYADRYGSADIYPLRVT